ncbi:hypothetical protein QC763_304890 [Podospora pseudopauciseta]|uniref:Uncharacterized protein n=1 Tax=Podospora pseudopauciseta TaxID=2093780 RepID=A0ABR0HFV1_9PEZI|nr:hypothetical protein QC763_304890 [Podospora pseudopauciseta]
MEGSFDLGDLMDLDRSFKPPVKEEKEKILPLRNLAGHMFVPVSFDLTTATPLQGRMQRLEHILKSIEFHRQGSRENLYYMFDREKQRLINEAEEAENKLGQDYRPALTPQEEDSFLASVSAPADPNKDYNVKSEAVLPLKQAIRPEPADKPLPVREKTVRDLMFLIESSISELDSFENAMKGIRDKYAVYKATGSTVNGVRVSGGAVGSDKRHRGSGDHSLDVSGTPLASGEEKDLDLAKTFSELAKQESSATRQQGLITPRQVLLRSKHVPSSSPLSKITSLTEDETSLSSSTATPSPAQASLMPEQISHLSKKASPSAAQTSLTQKQISIRSTKTLPLTTPGPLMTKVASMPSKKGTSSTTQSPLLTKTPSSPFETATASPRSTTPAPQRTIQNHTNITPQSGNSGLPRKQTYMLPTESSTKKKRSIKSSSLKPVAISPTPAVPSPSSLSTPTMVTTRPNLPISSCSTGLDKLGSLSISNDLPQKRLADVLSPQHSGDDEAVGKRSPVKKSRPSIETASGAETETPPPGTGSSSKKRVVKKRVVKKKGMPPNSNCLATIFANASNVVGEEREGEKKKGYETLSPRARRAAQERQWREVREEREREREEEEERKREVEGKRGFGREGGRLCGDR